MTPHLRQQILERLLATDPSNAVFDLVDAACDTPERLTQAIAELEHTDPSVPQPKPPPRPIDPPGAYLSSLRVAGFRGIGPEQTLRLDPGPGLTLLLGRNGSGKSSLAEGLETLLIGEAARWSTRKEWRDGWRNLHARAQAAHVEAKFAVEGGTPVVVRRSWAVDAELESSQLRVRRGSERLDGLGALGWETALTTFRPFLSHAELGALLARPSELYDKLKGILGLEELTEATKRLTAEKKIRTDRAKSVKAVHKDLVAALEGVGQDDPRARTCATAIRGRAWDLDTLDVLAELDALGDAVHPGWPEGRPLRPPRPSEATEVRVRVMGERGWLKVDGELRVDHAIMASCSGVSMAPGRTRRTWRWRSGKDPHVASTAAANMPVRPSPPLQCTTTGCLSASAARTERIAVIHGG